MTQHSTGAGDEVVAIVLAAGGSSRMGGVDKLWARLGDGAVVEHALRALAATPGVTIVVAVAPRERHAAIASILADAGVDVRCVEGGARRQDSVAAGIAAAPDAAWYLVHDGARPFAPPALAVRVLEAARAHGAAVPGLPVADTLKRVDAEGRVLHTIDRAPLRAVQTPQAFRGALLREAHARVRDDATDDAAMVERIGGPVVLVPGDEANRKITTQADLNWARALLAAQPATTGQG